jgi:hypothetical protein
LTLRVGGAPVAEPADPTRGRPAGRSAGATVGGTFDRRVLAVLGACAVLYAVFIWRPSFVFRGQRWFTLFDDAMISLTYARNLAEGYGLVWNPGGPAVEGYTNPLWTLILALCHRVGLPANLVPLLVSAVSALLVLGCVALAARIARRLQPSSTPTTTYAPVIAAVLVGTYFPLVYWSLRGMEVGLVTVLVLGGVLLGLRLSQRWSGRDLAGLCAVIGAGLLTRDDFVVPAAVLGGWLLLVLRGRDRRVAVAAVGATALAVMAAQVAFRLSYYGEPLPNTYYLKVAGQPFGPRLFRGAMTLVALILADLIVLIGVVIAGRRGSRPEPDSAPGHRRLGPVDAPVGLLLGLALALAADSVFVGGDAWEWARLANRYLTPAGVALLIVASVMIEPLGRRLVAARRPIFVLATVMATALALGSVDSFPGVLLHDWVGDYLGMVATDVGAATVTLAALALVAAVAWSIGGRRRLPPALARPGVAAALLVLAVLVAGTGTAWTHWVGDGGFYTAKNQGTTAYGTVLGEITEPGATIAVVWAGAPIYYARRDGIDLLGKMDPVIAHGPHHPGAPMYPGHDKWDFGYSIGTRRPDLIAQYAWFTAADIDRFVGAGYEPMRLDPVRFAEALALDIPRALLWVRSDSTRVERSALVPVPLDEAKAIAVEPLTSGT